MSKDASERNTAPELLFGFLLTSALSPSSMTGGLPGDTGGISGSGFPSGGVTGNLSMTSPASTMALQSVHTRSPVYPVSYTHLTLPTT